MTTQGFAISSLEKQMLQISVNKRNGLIEMNHQLASVLCFSD